MDVGGLHWAKSRRKVVYLVVRSNSNTCQCLPVKSFWDCEMLRFDICNLYRSEAHAKHDTDHQAKLHRQSITAPVVSDMLKIDVV